MCVCAYDSCRVLLLCAQTHEHSVCYMRHGSVLTFMCTNCLQIKHRNFVVGWGRDLNIFGHSLGTCFDVILFIKYIVHNGSN